MKNNGSSLLVGALMLAGLATVAFTAGPGAPAELFHLALSPESLSMLLAGLLAVLFDWFPGLAPWFGRLSKLKKQQVMIGLLGLVVAVVFWGACRGWFETGLACERESIPLLVEYVLAAAGANQAVHLLTKPC
ncbi:MAG TPA: hypothetical protein VGK00_10290 [Anaerolineales bacterium]|jgi:ABC-type sulfate transport system permease subunit